MWLRYSNLALLALVVILGGTLVWEFATFDSDPVSPSNVKAKTQKSKANTVQAPDPAQRDLFSASQKTEEREPAPTKPATPETQNTNLDPDIRIVGLIIGQKKSEKSVLISFGKPPKVKRLYLGSLVGNLRIKEINGQGVILTSEDGEQTIELLFRR